MDMVSYAHFMYTVQELQKMLAKAEKEREAASRETQRLKKNQVKDQIKLMQKEKKIQTMKQLFDNNISMVSEIWKESDKKENNLDSENRKTKLHVKQVKRDHVETEHLLKSANERIKIQEGEINQRELEIQKLKNKVEDLQSKVDKMEKELPGEESLANQLECALHELRENNNHITQVLLISLLISLLSKQSHLKLTLND